MLDEDDDLLDFEFDDILLDELEKVKVKKEANKC